MIPIQPILILALVAAAVAHLKAFHSRLIARVLTAGFVLLGVLFVLNPDFTNQLAHFVGVGRGADLVLYALFPISLSMFLHLYRKNRQLEEKLTGIAREMALRGAAKLGQKTLDES